MTRWSHSDSFEQFVIANSDELLRLAILVAGDRQRGEDALQESLISIGRAWGGVRSETAMAYARTVVARRAARERRRRLRIVEVELTSRDESSTEVSHFLRYEEDRRLVNLLGELPIRQRTVLVLRYCFDQSDSAIAATLHCSESTVRSQAFRALAKLRSRVVANPEDPS